ncbi:metal-dependent hydrolase [Sutcliffiella halmapala]
MGYIVHSILHLSVGACITYVLLNKHYNSMAKRSLVLFIGGFAGISPDITKFLGELYGHSLLSVPIIGLLIMLITRKLFLGISVIKLWIVLSFSVLSHIFIDYIGNGVALLYPFVTKEYGFHIIHDELFLYILSIASIIAIFYRKGKLVILSSLLIVALYLGILSYSKIQLHQTLKSKYQEHEITLLSIYPRWDKRWEFMIRTDEQSIIGSASIFGRDIQIEREREWND